MSKTIASRGYHLGWKQNKFEKAVENDLIVLGYEVHKQIRSLTPVHGRYRFYDIFVKDLGLIIEVDGEYWHSQSKRILIDIEKEDHVRNVMKLKFIRISDKDYKGGHVKDLLNMTDLQQMEHCKRLIASRQSKLIASQE